MADIGTFINALLSFEGQPYAWGGGHPGLDSPGPVDCSGLINSAFKIAGFGNVSRNDMEWFTVDTGASISNPVIDNVWDAGWIMHREGHVGVMLGGNKWIEATPPAVVIKEWQDGYWTGAAKNNIIGTGGHIEQSGESGTFDRIKKMLGYLTDVKFWIRIGEGLLGVIMIIIAATKISNIDKAVAPAIKAAKTAAIL